MQNWKLSSSTYDFLFNGAKRKMFIRMFMLLFYWLVTEILFTDIDMISSAVKGNPAVAAFIFISSACRVCVCTLGEAEHLTLYVWLEECRPTGRQTWTAAFCGSAPVCLSDTDPQTLCFSLCVSLCRSLRGWRVWRKDAPRSRRWVPWRWRLSMVWPCPECLCPMKGRTTRRTRLMMSGWVLLSGWGNSSWLVD